MEVISRLSICSDRLMSWNKTRPTNFRKEIARCKEQLEIIRCKLDPASVESFKNTKSRMLSLLVQEENHWQQRAKCFWLKDGDLNTKFFHATASAQKKIKFYLEVES